MRTFLYWLTSMTIAVLAAGASDQRGMAADEWWTSTDHLAANVLPAPEPSRAILLGVGIMAIAFTYRKAWLNLKRQN